MIKEKVNNEPTEPQISEEIFKKKLEHAIKTYIEAGLEIHTLTNRDLLYLSHYLRDALKRRPNGSYDRFNEEFEAVCLWAKHLYDVDFTVNQVEGEIYFDDQELFEYFRRKRKRILSGKKSPGEDDD